MGTLEIRDLTIQYSSGGYAVRPIEHLDLVVQAGSLALLLGPSGCGKTSLLSCLGGILSPHAGAIHFDGVDVTTLRGSALTTYRRNTVGIVFQAFNLIPSLTALDNVVLPLRTAGRSRAGARARAADLLAQVGLEDRAHHRPGDLSGGQQQRVALARALALDPPLLIADEPTAHLDHIQVEEVLRVLRSLATGDRVVVVSTHDQRLLPLADQVVELGPLAPVSVREPERVSLAPGEVLFRQGDWGELIYVVESGEVEIVGERADGSDIRHTVVRAGEHFGELGVLFAIPRSGTARALTDATVTGYSTRDFRSRVGGGRALTAPRRRSQPLRATVRREPVRSGNGAGPSPG